MIEVLGNDHAPPIVERQFKNAIPLCQQKWGQDAKAFSPRLVNQRSAQRNNKGISLDQRAIDRGIPNHQIASHQDRSARP